MASALLAMSREELESVVVAAAVEGRQEAIAMVERYIKGKFGR